MAQITALRPRSISITRFTGLNESVGETQLKLGESPDMTNFRVVDGFKLAKREGFETVVSGTANPIRALWYGRLNGVERLWFVRGGSVCSYDPTTGTVATVASGLTDAPTSLVPFGDSLYVLNGTEYRIFNGSALAFPTPYRPLVAVSTPPGGGGTDLESLNLLTGQKRQWFSGNASATTFQTRETSITSVDFVKLNGVTQTLTTHYTVNLAAGTVTFVTAPPSGVVNNVEVAWTKGSGDVSAVSKMRYATLYGGGTDSRIFLWGDSQNPNRLIWTGLADGVPSGAYFPALNFSDCGSRQNALSDCVRVYDRLAIFSDRDAWQASYETITDALGRTIGAISVLPLNGTVGNVAAGQVQLVDNSPVTLSAGGLWKWTSTSVRDERNAKLISERVSRSLAAVDLTSATTFDWQARGELWLCISGTVWIWNYQLDCWYRFAGIPAVAFAEVGGCLYFGTATGAVCRFDAALRADDDAAFPYSWTSGYMDCGSETVMKYADRAHLTMKPDFRSTINFSFSTNRGEGSSFSLRYSLATFEHCNFGAFGFETNRRPHPFRIKLGARKFSYIKIALGEADPDADATILSIDISPITGGESK